MKIIEKENNKLGIELVALTADQPFKYYDKKTNSHKVATYINDTPFWNKPHVCVVSGAKGSGKTTAILSLISSKKYKIYEGVFDTIIVCCPEQTLKSLVKSPFEDLPEDQIFYNFNEEFMNYCYETVEANSLEGKDTYIFLDDCGEKLRSNKQMIEALSGLVIKNRHFKLTIHILIQEIMMIAPTIRANCDGIIKFKPINAKREKIFHEEYFSELTYSEFLKLNDYIYKKKGDFLLIKFNIPRQFFKNMNEIFLSDLDNTSNGDIGKNSKKEDNEQKSKIEKKEIEAKTSKINK